MRKIEENKGAKTIVFYEAKRPSSKIEKKKRQKEGRVFSKNDAPLQRKGPFGNLEKNRKTGHSTTWKSWNGKHVNKESFVSMRDKAKDSKRLRTSGEALRISGDPQSPPEAAP